MNPADQFHAPRVQRRVAGLRFAEELREGLFDELEVSLPDGRR